MISRNADWLVNIDDTYLFGAQDIKVVSRVDEFSVELNVSMQPLRVTYADKETADAAWDTLVKIKAQYHQAMTKMSTDRDTKQSVALALQGKINEKFGAL